MFRRNLAAPGGTQAPRGADAERAAVMAALLDGTARLVAQTDALAVIRSLCECLVAATPHIRLAWAWFGEPDPAVVVPMVSVGPARAYAEALVIERNQLTLRGPVFKALRTSLPDNASVSRMSLFGPWRAAAEKHGFEVAVAFPLRLPDAHERGVIVFYADDHRYFDRVGREPFAALARLAEVALAQGALRDQLREQANHDPLTALPNRGLLMAELASAHANAQRYGRRFAVVMFDLDQFKQVNDRFGHDVGDSAIVAAGRAARLALREGDLFGRWGGEEFLAILPEADAAAATVVAERMRRELVAASVGALTAAPAGMYPDASGNTTAGEAGVRVVLRASFGVATYPASGHSVHDLLLAADQALYRAKGGGGDRICTAVD